MSRQAGERAFNTSQRPNPGQAGQPSNAPLPAPGATSTSQPGTYGAYQPGLAGPPATVGERSFDVQQRSPQTAQTTPARGLGMHSILNPSSENTPTSATDSISRLPPPIRSPRSRKRQEPSSPTREQVHLATLPAIRPVLTAKSPGLRAASLGTQSLPSIQTTSGYPGPAHTAPDSRVYTAEPGVADIPALPSLAVTQRSYAPIQPQDVSQQSSVGQTSIPTPTSHAVPPVIHPPSQDPAFPRPSPSLSHQTSPFHHYSSAPVSQNVPATYRSQTTPGGYAQDVVRRGQPENYHSGQGNYQMTLETDEGPMVVPVELDLLHASKVADEKRKRNAGASARFRARRKEKEKEASHTISSLQQDLRELRAERDFYREERNFMRDFAARHVGIAQLPVRPSSPISRVNPMSAMSGTDTSRHSDDGGRPRSDSAPAAQRRRTGDFQPTFSPPQSEQPMVYGTLFAPQQGMPLPPPHQPPPPHASPRSVHPGPPLPPPLGPRSQSSYDPFRRDPFDRAWEPSR
ncbi:uncharacterized protein HMPREF1541_06665 [Cyphellophora europaea CBS 101466]|uniref:BZIP domain-containing protein n=1 Tax=Cyphellophora europaea (strain CBS 101466) TaxID=1220924 RepID=W2RSA5_CYPE1|nr:uncharacterized protein HMPREF1541_06665 [Cyphellophora europaea CBS 101466]ETN38628.1 hypothetical protein HMPREF1541_06665 [Cyphellophora europaea CBS 101466]